MELVSPQPRRYSTSGFEGNQHRLCVRHCRPRSQFQRRSHRSGLSPAEYWRSPSCSTDLVYPRPRTERRLAGRCQHSRRMAPGSRRASISMPISRRKISAKSHVYGYVYPMKPTSSLGSHKLKLATPTLKFIQHYMSSITPEFNGRASGHVHFYGKFKGAHHGRARIRRCFHEGRRAEHHFLRQRQHLTSSPDGLTFRRQPHFRHARAIKAACRRLSALSAFQEPGVPFPISMSTTCW